MDEKRQFLQHRKEKVRQLRKSGINPYANSFSVSHVSADVKKRFADRTAEEIETCEETFSVAGRVVSMRSFGKAAFFHLQDRAGRIQVYIRKDKVGDETFALFKKVDIGDFLGIHGRAFLTRSDELTLLADSAVLLVKSLRPLPEKWHGLQDVETRYRQRYLDLIANDGVRRTFVVRNAVIQYIRRFFVERDFLEVETPMMHPVPGGAAAQPFQTHHNALDADLYLRIAPELYLKRLLIGGFERVFELNRNFRNEGISTQHNPEFTMLEFYQAYATFHDFMTLTEELVCGLCSEIKGSMSISYQGTQIDFSPPWQRLPLAEAVARYGDLDPDDLQQPEKVRDYALSLGIELNGHERTGEVLTALFEHVAEPQLVQPTFVTHFPTEVSPLARRNEENPEVTDRFELYIMGREIANAFSELNDPEDQRERFERQSAEKPAGSSEATVDEDFLLALEYGMPPAAGQGIGIDRLVMLLTDASSIRDVILFPLFRSERQ